MGSLNELIKLNLMSLLLDRMWQDINERKELKFTQNRTISFVGADSIRCVTDVHFPFECDFALVSDGEAVCFQDDHRLDIQTAELSKSWTSLLGGLIWWKTPNSNDRDEYHCRWENKQPKKKFFVQISPKLNFILLKFELEFGGWGPVRP